METRPLFTELNLSFSLSACKSLLRYWLCQKVLPRTLSGGRWGVEQLPQSSGYSGPAALPGRMSYGVTDPGTLYR